jgi:hypothetical protein
MIRETLQNAIRSLSNKHGISEKDLRIAISRPNKNLRYEIMKNGDILEETNIATALNLNSVVAFMVGNRINAIVDSIAKDYKIDQSKLNVRIYTKTEDCEPLLYLFEGKTPVTALDLNKFI